MRIDTNALGSTGPATAPLVPPAATGTAASGGRPVGRGFAEAVR